MTNKELQQLVETISLEKFNRAFDHQATFNRRLRTTGGRYLIPSHNLEFNPKQLEHYGYDEFIKIIKHELCHYHLHIEGRGYKHGDRDFKQLLNTVGGSRYCKVIPGTKNRTQNIHVYHCVECGTSYKRKKRINTKRFACGICHGNLKKWKTISHVDGKNSM